MYEGKGLRSRPSLRNARRRLRGLPSVVKARPAGEARPPRVSSSIASSAFRENTNLKGKSVRNQNISYPEGYPYRLRAGVGTLGISWDRMSRVVAAPAKGGVR